MRGVDLNRISTRNVIGKLTGSKYPNETVSYGGHWDAYGIGPADAQAGRSGRALPTTPWGLRR